MFENFYQKKVVYLSSSHNFFLRNDHMSKILVHVPSGPDLKNKVTFGLLVAVSTIKDGHDVSLFLIADGGIL